MKTVIEMAREAGWTSYDSQDKRFERFAELVRADEAEKYKWDVHSCGPTCEKKACIAMREAVLAEREACHALRQTLPTPHEHCQVSAHAYNMAIAAYGAAIRARSEA